MRPTTIPYDGGNTDTISLKEVNMRRRRNKNGRYRAKRSDTHLGTLERRYGELSSRRSDTHLGTLRRAAGKSLSKLLGR